MGKYSDLLTEVTQDTAPATQPSLPEAGLPPQGGGQSSAPGGKFSSLLSELQAPEAPKVIEEMHPAITFKDRLIAKNLGNSPESQAAYLKQQHPELETKIVEGRPYVRSAGEKEFRALDPNTGFFSKDLPYDVADLAYDIPAGTAQGAATGVGSLAGPLGAMGASGVTAASLEALRQKLGQWAGMPQTVDPREVATQGAVATLLPGVSKLVGGAARGVTNKVAPWIGSKISGVPKEAIQTLKAQYPQIEELNQGGILDVAQQAQKKLKSGLSKIKMQVGKEGEQAVTNAEGTVDLGPMKQGLKDLISEYEGKAQDYPSPTNKAKVEAVRKQYRDLFQYEVSGENGAPTFRDLPNKITPAQALDMKEDLKAAADLFKTTGSPADRAAAGDTKSMRKASNSLADAYSKINAQLDELTGGQSTLSNEQYGELSQLQKELKQYFGSRGSSYRSLSNLRSNPVLTEILSEVKDQHGIDLLKDARLLEAYKYFGKPSSAAISGFGTTSTSRTIPLAGLLGSLGSLIGYKTGGGYAGAAAGAGAGVAAGGGLGSPAMIKQLVEMGRFYDTKLPAATAYGSAAATPGITDKLMGIWNSLHKKKESEQ